MWVALCTSLWFSLAFAADDVAEDETATESVRGLQNPSPRSGLHGVLWPVRILLLPPRLVLMAVYVPPRETLRWMDRDHVVSKAERWVYWDEAQTQGLLPLVSYNSDFGPEAGAQFFDHDLGGNDESLSFKAMYGGRVVQSYDVHFDAEQLASSRIWLQGRVRYERNPKQVFVGVGVQPDAVLTRFSQDRGLGLLGTGVGLGAHRRVQLGTVATVNTRSFGPSLAVNGVDPSIETAYDTANIVGFDSGVTTVGVDAVVRADLRKEQGIIGSGLFFEGFGGRLFTDVGSAFWRYGAQLDLSANLFGTDRLLGVNVFLDAVTGDSNDVPFTELARLGGPDRLRGYREDQFRDARAFAASASYRYPVHANIEAELFFDAGTVASDYGALFDGEDWLTGFGGGLIFGSRSDVALRIDASYGQDFRLFMSTDFARAFSGRSRRL